MDRLNLGSVPNFSIYVLIAATVLLGGCATDTPLHFAAERGNLNEARRLIEQGADVNAKGNWETESTPLHTAAWHGKADVVRLLIEKGADVNAKNRLGATPLFSAAEQGRADIVRILIEKGADVNAKSDWGSGAIVSAAEYGHSAEIVRILIENGADIDSAIENLERRGFAAESRMIQRVAESRKSVSSPQGISKEDIKSIVQAAVAGAAQPQKSETKPAVQTDIDSPTFSPAEKIMGDNDLAVIIGIEGYQGLPKSDYSYDDAKLVSDYAKALGFKPRNIELLLDERATKSAIEKIIKTWLPNKAKNDSRIFIYYSGHGAPEPKEGEAYLVPYDGDPNYLPDTGYPLKRLYESLGKLHVAEITVVLDACFSGAGGRSVLAKGARPLVMMTEGTVLSSNMAVLSATQGTQISSSSPEKGHGVFTYYFLKALKDGKKNIADIYEYIKPLVEDEAKQLNVQQSPSINPDIEKLKGRFGLRK